MIFTLIGSNCEALGHPVECTEPAPGTVVSTSPASVTVNGVDVATLNTADMDFPTHSHDYDASGENPPLCHDNQAHTLDPTVYSSSVTLNGSPLYITDDGVGTDPGSGGSINIIDAGGNTTVDESP